MARLPHPAALKACRLWLRPVARWLLRSGVTWKEFAELSRAAFVSTAFEEFGLRGRPTNVSRVALLTGLSRRDVRRVREADGDGHGSEQADESLNHASRVLSGWHLDPDFLEADGRPRVLSSGGESSFDTLLRRYAGDIPATALVKELVRSGSIERLADGTYRVLRRYYMPSPLDGQAIERAGSVLADLAETIEYNLSRRPRDPSRFEGRAQNRYVDPRHLPAFRAFVEREAQGLLERVDDWLASHEGDAQLPDDRKLRLGIGVYAIQADKAGETA